MLFVQSTQMIPCLNSLGKSCISGPSDMFLYTNTIWLEFSPMGHSALPGNVCCCCCCFLPQKHGDWSSLYPNTTEALSSHEGRVLSQALSTVSKPFSLMLPAWKPRLSKMKSLLIKIMVLQFSVKMIDFFPHLRLDRCLTVKASGCHMNEDLCVCTEIDCWRCADDLFCIGFVVTGPTWLPRWDSKLCGALTALRDVWAVIWLGFSRCSFVQCFRWLYRAVTRTFPAVITVFWVWLRAAQARRFG